MLEKKKLLVTSNFSFSHSVFKRLVLETHKNQGLFGKGLKLMIVWDMGHCMFNILQKSPLHGLDAEEEINSAFQDINKVYEQVYLIVEVVYFDSW